jgi:hypothetical protein
MTNEINTANQFQPGNRGRPVGSKNKSRQLLDAINASDPEALQVIVDVTVKAARDGRPWAITAILDRVYPPLRDRTVTFDLPPIRSPEDIPVALDAVLQAASHGELTPSESASLCGTIIDCNQKIMTDVHVYLNTVKKLAEAPTSAWRSCRRLTNGPPPKPEHRVP